MASFKEGNLDFSFHANMAVFEYDKSLFYKKTLMPLNKSGVDFVAARRKTPPPDC